MSRSSHVRVDLNTLEQFFALALEQEAELNSSLRTLFLKHGIPNTRPSQWLQDLGNVIVTRRASSQAWLVAKVSRQTAKLVDALPVANVDARLTSVHAFAVTKAEAVSNLCEEFSRLGGHLSEDERTFMADMIQKAPRSFAELSTKYQCLSEQVEPLRPYIYFLSRSQASVDIESSLRTSTHLGLGDVQRTISPIVQSLMDLASDRALVIHEATVGRLRACTWDDRTSARNRSQAIDAMRRHRERLVWLGDQQVRTLKLLEREITNATILPTQVVDSDGNQLLLRELFRAASEYKSLCLNVMRAEELKSVVNLWLIAAQTTFVQGSFRANSV